SKQAPLSDCQLTRFSTGCYEYFAGEEFPHRREVEWLDTKHWKLPIPKEGLQSTVRPLGKFNENLLAIEQLIQTGGSNETRPVSRATTRKIRLDGISGRIQSVLERKGQVILYGPPGTGKTYWAERAAADLAAISTFGRLFNDLQESERTQILGEDNQPGYVRLCCFHPAYGYEDFIEGYRPTADGGQVSFVLRDGVFKQLCSDAIASPQQNFYLIVDEINRGDIPRIFGELLTILEKDKRGKRIILPVSQEVFRVPKNLFLIGTMNTADRSISLMDAALRRRFGFIELMPDSTVLKDSSVSGVALKGWLDAINERIRNHVGRDARNLQIGHSYLMHDGHAVKDIRTLKRAIRDDIIPLLEEYCYEDYSTLENILGKSIVDVSAARIRHELFADGQEDDLVDGLLSPFAELSTTTEAISTDEAREAEEASEELDEDDES
ncbi:AAA domain-containing protein, partial [bacterium]|nr:AAA domain-containing protein [bacterium]